MNVSVSSRSKALPWTFIVMWVATMGVVATCRAADGPPIKDPHVTWLYLERPKIEIKKPQIGWSAGLQDVWLRSLLLDEAELKRDVTDALTRAQSLGMHVKPEFRDVLWQIVQDQELRTSARVSAAQAYIAMGKPPQLDELSVSAEHWPTALAVVLEPALAAWDYQPLRELWQRRLQAEGTDPVLLRVAVEALGTVREAAAEADLLELLQDPHQPYSLKLVAARSVARLPSPRLLDVAQSALDDPTSPAVQPLLGVQLLKEQDSDAVIELLERFADLEDRVVAGEALRQLLQIAPSSVLARAGETIGDSDANVRSVTVAALATEPTPANIELLAKALSDPVLRIRREARGHLLRFAEEHDLRTHVVQQATAVLEGDAWRGIEQALVLLTQLQARGSRQRLFQLLQHERGEVMETAAWSIKQLAQPDWAQQCFGALKQSLERFDGQATDAMADTVTHLVETMGVLQMRESLELLRTFVPKNAPFSTTIRGAAVWSIGEVLRDQPQADVVAELESRLNDASLILPESITVRGMAAVSLGKMQSQGSLQHLVKWRDVHGLNTFIGGRSAWAIFKLTGEPIGEVEMPASALGGWFIQPLE